MRPFLSLLVTTSGSLSALAGERRRMRKRAEDARRTGYWKGGGERWKGMIKED
jgi:hypothetical protein